MCNNNLNHRISWDPDDEEWDPFEELLPESMLKIYPWLRGRFDGPHKSLDELTAIHPVPKEKSQ